MLVLGRLVGLVRRFVGLFRRLVGLICGFVLGGFILDRLGRRLRLGLSLHLSLGDRSRRRCDNEMDLAVAWCGRGPHRTGNHDDAGKRADNPESVKEHAFHDAELGRAHVWPVSSQRQICLNVGNRGGCPLAAT